MITIYFIALCLLGGLGWLVMTQPPKKAAAILVNGGPVLLIGLGVILIVLRRGTIGLPLLFIGTTWLRRKRSVGPIPSSGGQKSTVRSAHLDMELDHDTGEMDGTVLSGNLRGKRLSSLSEQAIVDLCREFHADGDTLTLLESYLDRRHAGWREREGFQSSGNNNKGPDKNSMSREEACRILGVESDATREEILQAWRGLIKKVHPDSGGSAFLTNKVNTAKDVLLR